MSLGVVPDQGQGTRFLNQDLFKTFSGSWSRF